MERYRAARYAGSRWNPLRWAEKVEQATKLAEEKRNFNQAFWDSSKALPPVNEWTNKVIPGDYIAIGFEEFLGMEAAYAMAMAELERLSEHLKEYQKIFGDVYFPTISDERVWEIACDAYEGNGELDSDTYLLCQEVIRMRRNLRGWR